MTTSLPDESYDFNATLFSPEGRLYQVEYAQNAANNSGTAIGMCGKDGVVFAVENIVTSKLYEKNANSRTFTINTHIGAVVAGFKPDARQIINMARGEAIAYQTRFESPAPLKHIVDNTKENVHAYTLYGGLRPFGANVIFGSYESGKPKLYCLETSGQAQKYFGCAIGRAREAARSEMENISMKEIPIRGLIKEAARIIYKVHNDERDFALELSWVGKPTQGKHRPVPHSIHEDAEEYAQSMIEESESDDSTSSL